LTAQVVSAELGDRTRPGPQRRPRQVRCVVRPHEGRRDDSKNGYHLAEMNRRGTYLITDDGSQAWAVVTQRVVILTDVPEPLPFHPALRMMPESAQDRRQARLSQISPPRLSR
jgi:hypothetical protein